MSDEKNKQAINLAVQLQMQVAEEEFIGCLQKSDTGLCIGAGWENNKNHQFEMTEFAKKMGVLLPKFLDFSICLESIFLTYQIESRKFNFFMKEKEYFTVWLSADLKRNIYGARLTLSGMSEGLKKNRFYLQDVPFIGKVLGDENYIQFDYLQGIYVKDDENRVSLKMGFYFNRNVYSIGDGSEQTPEQEVEQTEETSLKNVKANSPIHWFELKKGIGPCYLRRAGWAFEQGEIKIYIDAQVKIAILTVSLLELYLGVKMGKEFRFSYGLKGLAVTMNRPPIFIRGALYREKKESYSGELTVGFKQFALHAIGVYEREEKSGKDSFFVYIMLDYQFGGPPCFYITGLSAGFGINRRIHIPPVKEMESFPFIAAVRGKNEKLQPGGEINEVIKEMNSVIEPCEGVHFLTVGIKFTSFGMLESVAIINVTFGKMLECSLLGVSEMSLPPGSKCPIIYGCLNLRAVFALDEGVILIEGALSDNTYLFSENCKLSGGFAFYSWFKGEHEGDFVLTVGGYAPGFRRGHYPDVDRVRVNWIINEYLDLKGEAYFALTPNYLMAGGRLELNYHIGKLKAWCHAYADFLIRFKPFYYDISIGVSIGISYRLDFLFIHHTFSLEMGADLHLWGPEFSGVAHVKWNILSFTIRFNRGGDKPSKLDFEQFQKSFLPNYSGGVQGELLTKDKFARLNIANGLLKEAERIYYLDAEDFDIYVETAMPVKELQVGNQLYNDSRDTGILPMEITKTKNCLKILVTGKLSQEIFQAEPMKKNLPRALWDTRLPDKNAGLLKDVWMGCRLIPKRNECCWLPETYRGDIKGYDIDELLRPEIEKKYVIVPIFDYIDNQVYEKGDMEQMVKRRQEWLEQLEEYGVRKEDQVSCSHFEQFSDEVRLAPFSVRTLGYRGNKDGRKNKIYYRASSGSEERESGA